MKASPNKKIICVLLLVGELENLLLAQGYPPIRHSWYSVTTSLDVLHFR